MHFLEPWGLLGLSALAPIIALYFLKLKREERVVPSTLLWKKVIRDMHVNAPFQQLKYSLLLLLQLILIALLGFALARPFLSMDGASSRNIVLLIDTSASMATRDAGEKGQLTRLEHAVQDARSKIDDMKRGDTMRIVAFDKEVRQLTRFMSDKYFLKDKLNELAPRHLETRAQEAFETGLALADERPHTEVLVLSDGAFHRLDLRRLLGEDAGGRNTEEISLSRIRKLRFVPYGNLESDNIGITNISARSRTVQAVNQDGDKVEALETQVFVMVENFSSQDKKVILTLSSPSQRFPPKVLSLKARPRGGVSLSDDSEAGHTVEEAKSQEVFKLPLDTTGVVTASITSPKDQFDLDDQASVVVGHAEDLKVLWVTAGSYFLEKALAAMREAKVTKMTPGEFDALWKQRGPVGVEGYDVVLFDNHVPPRWEDGGVVFLGQLPPLSGFSRQPDEKVREFPEVIDWDNIHPVMRHVNFGNIQVAKAENWKVPNTTKTLVEGSGGPLVVAYETDRVHAVALLFSLLDSDWPYRSSLPLFIRNAITWSAEASPRRRPAMHRTGVPLVIPPIGTAPSAALVKPDGVKIEVDLSPDKKKFVEGIDRVGLYRLTGLPGKVEDEMVFAVNLADPAESDNETRREIAVGDSSEANIEAASEAIQSKSEFWQTLVMVATGLLLLEWFVYHRRLGL